LQRDQPRAIGIDIFRDLTTGSSRGELAKVLSNSSNIVGIEMALSPNFTVKPPPELTPEQVGLADVVMDSDGKLRRSLLASKVRGETRYSFALLLAEIYLQFQGISLQYGSRASDPIRLGELTLPRLLKNTGGYVKAKAGGNQVMLNFQASPQPFTIVSLTEVLNNKVPPDLIRDRIVLIGMTASSVNDIFMTSATQGTMLSDALDDAEQYQLLYGVEYQAHAISQMIHAVLDDRPLLRTWLEGWEYVWIVGWGLWGIALGLMLRSPWRTLLSLAVSSMGLGLICFGLMILGWWIPLVPAFLTLCAAGLTTSFFDRDARVLIEQRSLTLTDALPIAPHNKTLGGTNQNNSLLPIGSSNGTFNPITPAVFNRNRPRASPHTKHSAHSPKSGSCPTIAKAPRSAFCHPSNHLNQASKSPPGNKSSEISTVLPNPTCRKISAVCVART
jgi:CHASE2 domain-containing sensor protein